MNSLYLLLPLSVLLVLALIGLFAWALENGQFDDLDREGSRVLEDSQFGEPPVEDSDRATTPSKLDLTQVRTLPTQKN